MAEGKRKGKNGGKKENGDGNVIKGRRLPEREKRREWDHGEGKNKGEGKEVRKEEVKRKGERARMG